MKRLLVIIIILICLLSSCARHKHTYSSDWVINADGHMKECTSEVCDQTIAYAAHSLVAIDGGTQNECTVCGYKTENKDCVDSHIHTLSSECISDSIYHWRTCTSCGKTDEREEHVWSESSVTLPPTSDREGQADRVCLVCGRYSLITLERLPERMDEEAWISAFDLDNVRIKESMKNGSITSVDSVYSVDGNIVEVKSGGVISYASCSSVSHLDFSSLYSSFSHYGDQVYKADKVSITTDGISSAIKDVTAVFKDGKVFSISYSMSLGGIFGTFTYSYSFYDWAEVELSPKRLTSEEAETLTERGAFDCGFYLLYSKIDSSFTIHEVNLTVNDEDYLCKYYTAGRLVKTKKGDSAPVADEISRNIRSIINFEYLDVSDFVYEESSDQFVYIGAPTDIPKIGTLTTVGITVKDGRIASLYAETGNGDIYSYEFTYY